MKQQVLTGFACLLAGAGIVLWFSSLRCNRGSGPIVVPGNVQVIHSRDTTVTIFERIGGTQILKPEFVIMNPETVRLTDSIYLTPPGHIPASFRRLERGGNRLSVVYCLDTVDSEGIVWSGLREYNFKVSPWNDYIVAVDVSESLVLKSWSPLRWGFGIGAEGGAHAHTDALLGAWGGYYTPLVIIWAEKGAWQAQAGVTVDEVRANIVWRMQK